MDSDSQLLSKWVVLAGPGAVQCGDGRISSQVACEKCGYIQDCLSGAHKHDTIMVMLPCDPIVCKDVYEYLVGIKPRTIERTNFPITMELLAQADTLRISDDAFYNVWITKAAASLAKELLMVPPPPLDLPEAVHFQKRYSWAWPQPQARRQRRC